jgi:hypothetical protein
MKNDRTEVHKFLLHVANSPGVSEKVQAAAIKSLGELEVQYAKLRLARLKSKQAREKQKASRKHFGID